MFQLDDEPNHYNKQLVFRVPGTFRRKVPTRQVDPCFSNGPLEGGQFCLYNATAVGITSVLSEDAPHLALHGVFPTGDAEVLDVTSWKPLKCFEVDKMDQLHAIHFDQLVSRWWF